MTATSEGVVGPPARPGPVLWLKKNLFSTWLNTLLTIVSVSVVAVVVCGLIRWIFFHANWSPVVQNLRLYAVGPYPARADVAHLDHRLYGLPSDGRQRRPMARHGADLCPARWRIAYIVLAVLPISLEYLALDTRLRLAGQRAGHRLGLC